MRKGQFDDIEDIKFQIFREDENHPNKTTKD